MLLQVSPAIHAVHRGAAQQNVDQRCYGICMEVKQHEIQWPEDLTLPNSRYPAALNFSIHMSGILVAIQVFTPEPACIRKPRQRRLHAMIAIIH